jgi:hypothetical protein
MPSAPSATGTRLPRLLEPIGRNPRISEPLIREPLADVWVEICP